ncbi:MAG: tetratricopeptide repeat protein [Desulfobacteraceae bacterium]|nr:MAG: tetratricopeptide repeat protein [Desulfobacteraceae bacterium]
MDWVERIFGCCICIFIMGVFSGCASPPAVVDRRLSEYEVLRPGVYIVYRPAVRPGTTFDSAKKELAEILTSESKPIVVDNSLPVHVLRPLLGHSISEKMLELQISTGKIILPFEELAQYPLLIAMIQEGTPATLYNIYFENRVSFFFGDDDLPAAKRFADALLFMKQSPQIEKERQLALFEPIAARYRESKIKPQMSEEQRRLIVQANALNQKKEYGKAIEQYSKAIALDPTSYPAAYFNLALLSAQENKPLEAIFFMKHYLLLTPEAKDARSAQDKIYEWELMLK